MAKGTAQFTPPTIQHPLEANLGDRVRFLGYDLNTTSVKTGDTLHRTLYWQALAEMDESYTVFTHLLDKSNRIWGQREPKDLCVSRSYQRSLAWQPWKYFA